MAANVANLPLQLLITQKVMEALDRLSERATYAEALPNGPAVDAVLP
jgi:hypothetical protein